MIKDIVAENEKVSSNKKEIEVLKANFPSCFNRDGSFDIERFKEAIRDDLVTTGEGYELRFLGKNYARLLASIDTTTVIIPDEVHNNKTDNKNSSNVYISGDNLDGLKQLLKSYAEKIKCIYIDPPYNTGKDDFAYNDRFEFSISDLAEKLSISEEQATRILDLTTRGSSSHSAWLTFIYPRLILARDLLTTDGCIFISIDDNEMCNLKLACDDIFGEENYIGTVVWNNATDNNPTNIAVEHEYVLCYARNKEKLFPVWKSNVSAIKELLVKVGEELSNNYPDDKEFQEAWSKWYKSHKSQLSPLDRYKYIDRDGVYTGSQSVHNPGKEGYRYDVIHPITHKPCVQPLMGYRFPESTMKDLLKQGKILFGADENKIIELKVYAKEYKDKLSSIFELDGRLGAYDIKSLFPEAKQLFKNPKPVQLIQWLLSFTLGDGDIFLDYFSGSGTSAEAVVRLIEQGRDISFIQVQIMEETKEDSEARKLGYQTIDQVGIERISRAIERANKNILQDKKLGFLHYFLKEPESMTLEKLEKFSPEDNGMFIAHTILEDFGISSVISTWLVRDGYGFSAIPEKIQFADYTGYYIGKHLYLIASHLSNEAIAAITDSYELDGRFNAENVVMFGYSFNWTEIESLKTNLARLKDTEKNLRINLDVRY